MALCRMQTSLHVSSVLSNLHAPLITTNAIGPKMTIPDNQMSSRIIENDLNDQLTQQLLL
jgi:hypothetical protein